MSRRRLSPSRAFLAAALILCGSSAIGAEAGKIKVEFNDLQQAENACRAVFVLNNGLDKPLAKLALRVVAFDKQEHATLFLAVDVGALPIGKTRVLRFDMGEGVACGSIGRLVLDDVTSCAADGLGPAECLAAMSLSTKAGVPFDF